MNFGVGRISIFKLGFIVDFDSTFSAGISSRYWTDLTNEYRSIGSGQRFLKLKSRGRMSDPRNRTFELTPHPGPRILQRRLHVWIAKLRCRKNRRRGEEKEARTNTSFLTRIYLKTQNFLNDLYIPRIGEGGPTRVFKKQFCKLQSHGFRKKWRELRNFEK